MHSNLSLSGSHLRTYQTIFQHPLSHNLGWREVHALFRHLGEVEEEANGNLKVSRNGEILVLHPSRHKDVAEADELMALRHFLERSEAKPAAAPDVEPHWLLVIDHREARVFRLEDKGVASQQILPHAPETYFRQAHHAEEFSRARERPDPNSFFAPVAQALQSFGPILLFGTGTGMGSEMEQFLAWLKARQPEIALRVVGSQTIDEHHLTEDQIVAKARAFFAQPR